MQCAHGHRSVPLTDFSIPPKAHIYQFSARDIYVVAARGEEWGAQYYQCASWTATTARVTRATLVKRIRGNKVTQVGQRGASDQCVRARANDNEYTHTLD